WLSVGRAGQVVPAVVRVGSGDDSRVREYLHGPLHIALEVRAVLPVVHEQVNVIESAAQGGRQPVILQICVRQLVFVNCSAELQVRVDGFQVRDHRGKQPGSLVRGGKQSFVLIDEIVDPDLDQVRRTQAQ